MVRESQQHASEDQKWKEEADTRNEADALSYQVERLMSELGEKVSGATRARSESAIKDLRTKLEQRSDAASIKRLMEELRSVMSQAQQDAMVAAQAQAAQPDVFSGAGAGGPQPQQKSHHGANQDDDIIDAEYTAA